MNGNNGRFYRLKDDFIEAFYHRDLGGVEGLVEWAKENRSAFYKLIVSILPKELNLTGEMAGPILLSDPERVTKLQYVLASLEKLARGKMTPISHQIESEPLLIDDRDEIIEGIIEDKVCVKKNLNGLKTSNKNYQNLARFVERLEEVKIL